VPASSPVIGPPPPGSQCRVRTSSDGNRSIRGKVEGRGQQATNDSRTKKPVHLWRLSHGWRKGKKFQCHDEKKCPGQPRTKFAISKRTMPNTLQRIPGQWSAPLAQKPENQFPPAAFMDAPPPASVRTTRNCGGKIVNPESNSAGIALMLHPQKREKKESPAAAPAPSRPGTFGPAPDFPQKQRRNAHRSARNSTALVESQRGKREQTKLQR